MSARNRSRALAALALLLGALPLSAQTVRGTVVDAATGTPVAGATVTVLEGERRAGRAVTGVDGAFVLELRRPGVVRLRAERLGYAPVLSEAVDVERREIVEMRLPLSVEAVALRSVTVTARQQPPTIQQLANVGFYERERFGFGRFLRREEIVRIPGRSVADVLATLPGIRKIGEGSRATVRFDRAVAVGALSERHCSPMVYLDGVVVSMAGGLGGLVDAERVEAIETYSGPAQAQPPFNGTGSDCGVVVIWTRTGV